MSRGCSREKKAALQRNPNSMEKAGVIGAGSWGTALAVMLGGNGTPVALWGHDAGRVERMRSSRLNEEYLPGVRLPETITPTASLEDLLDARLLVFVAPSKAAREVSGALAALHPSPETIFLSCTKGIERGSGLRMSEVLSEYFPNPVAVLSGPNHAAEVARRMPTAAVIAARENGVAERLQSVCSGKYFRVYTSDDVAGVELGGALKNIFAISAGVSDGLGFGDNSKAALMTRGLAELIRLGVALGGRRETFQGLSGIGDLMVTCFSRHSRNRAVGERLGKGERLADIVASMSMVAEGVPTTYSAHECARRFGVETPIIDQVRALLDGTVGPRETATNLITREPKAE